MNYLIEWIETTIEEAKNLSGEEIDDTFEHKKFNEAVVGNVSKDLKKFKTIINKRFEEVRTKIEKHKEKHEDPDYDGSECPIFHQKLEKRIEKVLCLNDIFWLELKERINYKSKEGYAVGIRKNWEVVEFEKKDNISDFEEELVSSMYAAFEMFNLFTPRPGSFN